MEEGEDIATILGRLWIVHCPGSDGSIAVQRAAIKGTTFDAACWAPAGIHGWEADTALARGGAAGGSTRVYRPRLDWTIQESSHGRPPSSGGDDDERLPPAALVCDECVRALEHPSYATFGRGQRVTMPPCALSNDMLGAVPRDPATGAKPAWLTHMTEMDEAYIRAERPFDTTLVLHRGALARWLALRLAKPANENLAAANAP